MHDVTALLYIAAVATAGSVLLTLLRREKGAIRAEAAANA